MKRPIHFSQNFLRNPALAENLLARTNITGQDTVYDIGAGKGILTSVVAPKCQRVVAIEADPKLVAKLRKNLKEYSNVLVYEEDFLKMPTPSGPYKVFANIPFNLSADILHKLVDTEHPPTASYLIVQREFAEKLVTKKGGYNSQLAILLGIKFEVRIVQKLRTTNFYPRPKVSIVFLEILQRPKSLVPAQDYQAFRDFVIYAYNCFKPNITEALLPIFGKDEFAIAANALRFSVVAAPSQLDLDQWLGLFRTALGNRPRLEKVTANYEYILSKKHATRTKRHRTSQL